MEAIDASIPAPSIPPPSALSKLIINSGAKTTAEALPLEVLHNLRHQHGWRDLRLHTIPANNISVPATTLSTLVLSASDLSINTTSSSSGCSTPTLRSSRPPLRSPNRSPVRASPLKETSAYSPSPLSISTTDFPPTPSPPSLPPPTTTSELQRPITLISGRPPRHLYLHPDFQSQLLKRKIDPVKDFETVPIPREWVLPVSLGEKWSLKRICAVFDSLPDREAVVVDVNGKSGGKGWEWKDAKRIVMAMLAHNGYGGDGTVAYYIVQEGEVKPRQN